MQKFPETSAVIGPVPGRKEMSNGNAAHPSVLLPPFCTYPICSRLNDQISDCALSAFQITIITRASEVPDTVF